MKRIILLSALLLLGGLVFSLLEFNSYDMKNINDFLKDQVDKGQTPSIQYAFFDTDSILFESSYGLKNVKQHTPVDAATTYHLYSITKTFTALSVLQLAQAGKLGLDQPVVSYLPEFPYSKEITIEQLLSHTAGIPNPIPLKWIHLESEHDQFNRDRFFAEIFKAYPSLDFEPGAGFKYSNLGYVILGQLVERVSGLSFEDYVQENIIAPSGINTPDLGFGMERDRHAVGYHKWWSISNAVFGFLIDKNKFMGPREGKWKPFHRFYNNGVAYGGMFGSASGLIPYAQTLLRENSVLLNDHYKQQLFSERIIQGKPTGMSLSWFTGSLKGNKYFAHAGGGGGYYVELRVYPELGVGSIIMYNRSGMKDQRMLDKADRFFITEPNGPKL
ncbi:MAG: beta-lactamase family protein [Saprospirales bacterium]|nr:beta-lactamase family protein [Saprospirales bacterium]